METKVKYAGQPKHKLRGLTTTVLGSLIEDLHRLEKTGYSETQCDMVKDVLKKINENCQRLASSAWMSQIALDYDDFYNAYVRWNGSGTDTTIEARDNRKSNVKFLQKYQQKWRKHVHKKHKENIANDFDLADFSDKSVELLKSISDTYPEYFANLNGSTRQYAKVRTVNVITEL